MSPRGVESEKRKRQYEHLKESELKRGASDEDVERIVAATSKKLRERRARLKVNSLSQSLVQGNQLIIDLALGKIYIYRFYCSV